ncbi:MAG: DUF523 domain-containing protein [Ruminococcaceae bacterium]|nr:DUF523 domain-containing protein [Oscillospiraceae bacterium]
MKIVVSACLLGENCKYNGGNNDCPAIKEFVKGREVIAVCPEKAAGLGVPRDPIEIVDGIVRDKQGNSVQEPLRKAVEEILAQLAGEEIDCVILKSRSPTCGVKQVYDGSFTGTLVDGMGILAQALHEKGYRVVDSEDFICNE